MTRRCPGIATVMAAALCASSPAATPNLKGWRDGPVSYLLTPEEYDAFGRLKDNGERETFIDRFWKLLDRDAATPRNEFRETFEQRCRSANARFGGGFGGQGWRSDRGKVFILLGEPTGIRHGPGGIRAADTEEWTYGSPDDPASDLHVVFFRCNGALDYQLDSDCGAPRDMTSVALDWERTNAIRRIIERNPGLSRSRLRNLMGSVLTSIPGGIVPPRPTEKTAAGAHDEAAPPSESDVHALVPEAYFFLARDGSVLTLLSLEMLGATPEVDGSPATSDGEYLGAVSIRPATPSGEPPDIRTLPLTREPSGTPRGPAQFFGSEYLEAGRAYAVRYAVQDVTHDALLVRHVRLAVPHLDDGLSMSSIVPAASFGPAPATLDGPFRVGSEEVVPKPGGIFRRADLLRLYFQVYGAATDPRTAKPRVDVEFRFVLVGPKGEKRVGQPFSIRGATGPSMGVALPIGDWPAGEYRVSVALKDRVSGQRTSGDAAFRIVED